MHRRTSSAPIGTALPWVALAIACAASCWSSHAADRRVPPHAGSGACQDMLQIELETLRRDAAVLREGHARDSEMRVALPSVPAGRTRGGAHRRTQIDRILREPIR